MREIDLSHDEIRLVHLGPMMGIDMVQVHHLIGMDWAQDQSKIEIKLINSHLTKIKKVLHIP